MSGNALLGMLGGPAPTAQSLSGFLRREHAASQAAKPGRVAGQFRDGLTALPYRVLGAPVDMVTMGLRPMGYGAADADIVGGSEWMLSKAQHAGLHPGVPQTGAGMAGDLLGQVMTPGAGPGEAKAVSALIDPMQAAIMAWHASPHKFDKFDYSRVGSGSGRQTYGEGLYFSEDPGIAGQHGENMYRVELSPNKEDLMDWEAPIASQSPKVRDAMERIIASDKIDSETRAMLRSQMDGDLGLTGGQFYRTAQSSDNLEGQVGLSALMREYGIPGLSHIDASHRLAGTGPRNYVMFDDASAKIKAGK